MQTAKKYRDPMDYSDGRTKQAFKDESDINKMLAKVSAGETITHLAKHGAIYGDFTDIDDLLTGMNRLKKGQAIFADLPGEIRKEFDQDVGKFFNYVNDPENKDRLETLLPALTAQGRQLLDTRKRENIELDPTVIANPEPTAPPPPAPTETPTTTPPAE